MTLVLERSGVQIVSAPKLEFLEASYSLMSYQPDAQVLAAAWSAGCDYFVTLDRKHFLDDPRIVKAVQFPLGTPGDFLNWYKTRLIDQ